MYCPNCGNQLPEEARYCDKCGAQVAVDEVQSNEAAPCPAEAQEPAEAPAPKASNPSPNITLGTDGKYHWYYEYKLMKNPTVLKVLMKIFFWIGFGLWLFIIAIGFVEGGFNMKDFKDVSKVALLIVVLLEALTLISYLIYAALHGFRYCVLFEMDDKGVTHTQMPRQFRKAQAVSAIAVLAGMAANDPGAVGRGILSGSKSAMASNWSAVRSIEVKRRHEVIKVNERLNKNQVYALKEDFPFVEEYIKSHVTKKCKVYER